MSIFNFKFVNESNKTKKASNPDNSDYNMDDEEKNLSDDNKEPETTDYNMGDTGGEGDTPPEGDDTIDTGEIGADETPPEEPTSTDYNMDDTTGDTGTEPTTDDTGADPTGDEPTTDDTGTEPTTDDTTGDDLEDPTAGSDYNMDDTTGDTGAEPTGDEQMPDDTTGDEATPEEQEADEVKALEKELFSDVDKNGINIRDKELKKLFVTMYNSISSILIKINLVPRTEQNIQVLDFAIRQLKDVREQIHDYLIDTFKNKSYTDNSIIYYEFIAVMEKIHKMIEDYVKPEEELSK